MKKRFSFLAALLIITAASPLLAAGAGTLSLSGGAGPAGPSGPDAFLTSVPRITATLSTPIKEKTRVEFRWTEPSGAVYSDTSRLLFPQGGRTQPVIKDRIEIAGRPASGKPGWWRVDAAFNGEILSIKFFLTDNRQVPAFFYGDKPGKLEVLSGLDLSKHGVKEIMDAAAKDGDADVRASSIAAVKDIKEAWGLAALEKGMEDPEPSVRAEAFNALLIRGGGPAAGAAEKASADASPDVRALAAEKIPETLGAKSGPLMAALVKDPHPGVRSAALASLAAAGGGWVIETLSEGLKSDDAAFRKRVLNVIAFKKGDKADALSEGLKDSEPAIRAASLKYLVEKGLATPGALRPLVDDPSEEIAASVLRELEALKDTAGIRSAARSRHKKVRLKAVRLLSADPSGNADVLAEAAGDAEREVRKEAVGALAKAGAAGTAGLLAALGDRDEEIRADAAYALLQTKAKRAEGRMLAALEDPSRRVRLHALRYFISLGGPGLPEILAKTACSPDYEARSEALARLVDTPGEDASGALAAFLACGDQNIKNTVIDSLAVRRDKKAEAALVSALKDGDAGVRFRAASLLLASGAAAPFGGLLEDPDPQVRKVALAAVQASPGPALVPALSALSKDPDPDIRLAVLEVLKGIPGEAPASITASLAADGNAQVKGRARALVLARREDAAVETLLSIAAGGGAEERGKAAKALGSIKGGHAEEALARLAATGGPEEKIFSLSLLAERKSLLLAGAVKRAVDDPEERVRLSAVERLGGLPAAEASEIYIRALSSKYLEVRRAGVAGLRGTKDKKAAGGLLALLNDPSPVIKREALNALIKAGDASYAGELPRLILDPDPDLRRAAHGAALSLPDPKLKSDALVAAAGGPYPDLSQVAASDLVPLGDPRALPYFIKYFEEGYSSGEMLEGIKNVPGAGPIPCLEKAYLLSGSNEARKLEIVKSLDGRGTGALNLLRAALEDSAPGVRLEAAHILTRRWRDNGPEWEAALGAALGNEDFLVRKAALGAALKAETPVVLKYAVPALADRELLEIDLAGLRERREPEVIPAVFEQAKGLNDADARAGAIALLSEKGIGAYQLASAFSDDPSDKVRAEVVKALAGAKGPEAVLRLAGMGGKENGPLREKAWEGIKARDSAEISAGIDMLFSGGSAASAGASFLSSRLGDPGLLRRLVEKAAGNPEGMKSALTPIIDRHAARDAQALVEGVVLADKKLADASARALSLIEGAEAAEALSGAFHRYPASRVALLKSVSGTPKIKALMEPALLDPDPAVRREAAESLKDPAGPGTAEILLLALACPEEDIRLAAAEAALAGNYLKPLATAATDRYPAVRAKAASGLRNFPEEVPALKTLALDRDAGVSGAALGSLKEMEGRVSSSIWAEIGRTSDRKDARLLALETLAKRRDASQAGVFVYLLEDADPEVSGNAEAGLAALGPKALPSVHPLLKKKKLMPAALRIIRSAGDPSSEPFVLEALPGLDGDMRLLALNALGKTGGDASVKYLEGLYGAGKPEEKVAAVKALGGLRLSGRAGDAARVLSDALSSKEDDLRFYAAYAAGRLKLKGMKGAIEEAAGAEKVEIVKSQMMMAVRALEGPD